MSRVVFFSFFVLLLGSCGGGGGGSSGSGAQSLSSGSGASNSNTATPGTTNDDPLISAKVIDGYIQGANVYIDFN